VNYQTGGKLWRTDGCHRAKLRQNQPNDFEDIAIFKNAAVRHLGY